MAETLKHLWTQYGPQTDFAVFASQVLMRLLMAGVLGGVVGLERELRHKPAGLRTNMFICFGSAMFTILSEQLANQWTGDHTRIAAQIIPGIGFIGAGSILHSRGSVTGLTTAATIFVVASIGMASGGGMYLTAIFATTVIVIALNLLGWLETSRNLKPAIVSYEVTGNEVNELLSGVNQLLEEEEKVMRSVRVGRTDGRARLQFTVDAGRSDQLELLRRMHSLACVDSVECLTSPESE